MELFEIIILGVVQGLAEFLPISSSAHLILVSSAFGTEALPLSANIALHLGTLLAVLLYFWRDWFAILSGLFRKVSGGDDQGAVFRLQALIIGSIPAGIIGLGFKSQIEEYLHHPLAAVAPLAVFGVIIWWGDRRFPREKSWSSINLKQAFVIGIFQSLALIPGVSRSGSTILGGRIFGLKRDEAARFSFLLGTPAMLAASMLEMKDILALSADGSFFIGILASFVTGCLTIKFFLSFLKRFGFGGFAIYRVILAVVTAVAFWPS